MKDPTDFWNALFSGIIDPYNREIFRPEDNHSLVEKWRNQFAKTLYDKTGYWHIRGMDWHVFSYEYASALEGKEAIAHYQKRKSARCYIFTHANSKHSLGCTALYMPTYDAIENALSSFRELADVYVTPLDLSWTFVVTHETSAGIGPFYSEKAWVR